jgi:hypothetical protein
MVAPQTPTPGGVFISYRREETAYAAGWLYDRLRDRFGAGRIFKDIDNIEPGDDFVESITTAVGSCDVLLALIGEGWLTLADESGARRLANPQDFVRLEIEAALSRGVRVVPLLISGARMPRQEQLPASLAPLVRRQALELTPTRFAADTARLLSVLERTLADVEAGRSRPAPAWEPTPALTGQPVSESTSPPARHESGPESAPEPAPIPEPIPEPDSISGKEPVPEALPEPTPVPVPQVTVDAESDTQHPPAPTPVASAQAPPKRVRWWAIGLLVGAGMVLVAYTDPNPSGTIYAWKNYEYGWYLKRTNGDPYMLGTLVVLVGAAVARWWRVALGAAVGAAAFLASIALVYLSAGLTGTVGSTDAWVATLLMATGVLVVGWFAAGVTLTPRRPVPAPAIALLAAGVLLSLLGNAVEYNGASWLKVSNGLGLLSSLALAAMGALTLLVVPGGPTSRFITAAAVTFVVLSLVNSFPLLPAGVPQAFAITLAGYVLFTGGVAVAARQPSRRAVTA